jgi:para-nitrobenzyl esterase
VVLVIPVDVVTIEPGRLLGTSSPDRAVFSFLGIPYAAAPMGELRWRPPQPLAPWAGARDATAYGPASRQPAIPANSLYYGREAQFSEDCLYLNVWTGSLSTSAAQPVMVWLHPGAYQFGSGQNPLYDGSALARDGITLVTVNHRLGRFGFLAHPLLSGESDYHGSGNYGLMDIIAALRWIQQNIEQFGGNPDNVTIFGVSAGGNSVHNLRASPLAQGLIHRSIAQSGPGVGPVLHGYGHALGPSTLAAGEQAGLELTDLLGVRTMAELRRLPAEAIESVQLPRAEGSWRFKLIPGAQVSTHVFDSGYPVIDGYVLPHATIEAYRRGQYLDIPLLVGNTSNESSGLPYLGTLQDFEGFMRQEFGAFAEEALRLYPATSDAEAQRASWQLEGDRTFVWSSRTAARLQYHHGSAPAWHYWFDRVPPIPASADVIERDYAAAFHTAEVPYVFKNLAVRDWPWTAADHRLAGLISGAWQSFARTGDPNGDGLPTWPRYDPGEPSTLVWDLSPHVGQPLDQRRMDFLDRFNGAWNGKADSVAVISRQVGESGAQAALPRSS